MRSPRKLLLLAAAALSALTFSGTALAAYAPKLMVSHHVAANGTTVTDITFEQTNADDPTAFVNIYSSVAFRPTLDQPVGTQIGTLDGSVVVGAIGGAVVPVTGTIVVGDRSSASLMAAAKQCTGTESHTAIWLLNVSAGGTALPNPVAVFVDAINGNSLFSAGMRICLPPPALAPNQIKLLAATLHLNGVFALTATAGTFRWSAVNVRYNELGVPVGGVETQSIVRAPATMGLTVKRITRTRKVRHRRHHDLIRSYFARVSGTANAGGEAIAGARIAIFAGNKKLATVRTSANGEFRKTFRLKRKTTFRATASRAAQTVPNAVCSPQLDIERGIHAPCGTVTEGAYLSTTRAVTVKRPKRTRTHLRR